MALCTCNILVKVNFGNGIEFINFHPIGVLNGKTLYADSNNNYVIYWETFFATDYWVFNLYGAQNIPGVSELAYLDLVNPDCPIGTNNEWVASFGDDIQVFFIETFENCEYNEPVVPIQDYCCALLVFLIGDYTESYNTNVELYNWIGIGTFVTYRVENTTWLIRYIPEFNIWVFYSESSVNPGQFTLLAHTTPNDVPDGCPVSFGEKWILTIDGEDVLDKLDATSFFINVCNEIDYPTVNPPEPSECVTLPARNRNALVKATKSLSTDIAFISRREVYGMDCSDSWNNIFMRSLIIDSLYCYPYGFLTKEQEQCLLLKLNDKCDC
jgi:hypothetical protein